MYTAGIAEQHCQYLFKRNSILNMTIRLRKVTQNDPVERLAVSVRKSTVEMLEGYREHYKKAYGEEIEKSHLVEEILRDYMTADKDFVREFAKAAKPKK